MKKQFEYAVCRALECLLNVQLSKQQIELKKDKDMRMARDKYISATIRLLESVYNKEEE